MERLLHGSAALGVPPPSIAAGIGGERWDTRRPGRGHRSRCAGPTSRGVARSESRPSATGRPCHPPRGGADRRPHGRPALPGVWPGPVDDLRRPARVPVRVVAVRSHRRRPRVREGGRLPAQPDPQHRPPLPGGPRRDAAAVGDAGRGARRGDRRRRDRGIARGRSPLPRRDPAGGVGRRPRTRPSSRLDG